MKYSNAILTDDNFDEELEKLELVHGFKVDNFETYSVLPKGYTKQEHENGFDEWINSKVKGSSGIGCDHSQAFQSGYIAYEFGDQFIALPFETVL